MSAQKRYYVPKSSRTIHGCRLWDVIDRQTDKSVYDSIFQSQAIQRARKLNIGEAAITGGFNKRYK